MSFVQAIRSKIIGVKNTQKITRAMEMVAASKMRKAQDRMLASRPYALKIREVITRVAGSDADYRHPYFEPRPQRRVAFIIVTSDRGLCGSLNSYVFKAALQQMQDFHRRAIATDLGLIGHKAENFFRRFGGQVLAQAKHLGDAPQLSDVIGVVKVFLDHYKAAALDSLYIAYNEFVNTMTQKPRILPLIPIMPATKLVATSRWDYLYEPAAQPLLELLATRYIEAQFYQAIVENIACEQAARMMAMKSATENAGELITELQLAYNKARQASITKELAEIVAGAEAV